MGDGAKVPIFFDQNYQIRVLEADKYAETEQLHQECKAFVASTQTCAQLGRSRIGAVASGFRYSC
jgi:hypothetical protein